MKVQPDTYKQPQSIYHFNDILFVYALETSSEKTVGRFNSKEV